MNANQKKAFWSGFIVFSLTATGSLYENGKFEHTLSLGGAAILVVSFLAVAYALRTYIVQNPEEFDD